MNLIERKETVKEYCELEFNKSDVEYIELAERLSNWDFRKSFNSDDGYVLTVYKNPRGTIFIEINADNDYSTFYKVL